MLVLSRREDEVIVIGDNEIRIMLVEIRGEKIRIGIECPPGISVHREEIYNIIKKEGKKIGSLAEFVKTSEQK